MSIRLTITAKGQVTLRKEVLRHLGLKPGDSVTVELREPGRVELLPPKTGSVEDLFGRLPNNGVSATIEEINEATAAGWAGLR